MTSSRVRQNFFLFLLAVVLAAPTTALAFDWANTISWSSTIITVGIACFGLLALYVLFLTVRFLIGALQESSKAKKEAASHAVSATKDKKESQASLSVGLGLGVLYALLAMGILFIVSLSVLVGMGLSFTMVLGRILVSAGFLGFAFLFLYIVFFLLAMLWNAVKPAKTAAAVAETQPVAGGLPVPAVTRRSFITLLGWAWVAFTAASLGALSTVLRFFFPNVTFEPPLKFKAGFPDTYKMGVDERYKDAHRCWIVRNDQGFYALSTICTHLGCTPNWMQADQKFKCPCHGSGYYITGINFEGPAPRPLPRFNIIMADDGQIQIDEAVQYQYELGQWGLPGSFLNYKG